MSIFIGANELTPLDRIYVGATEVKSVYVGAVLAWEKYLIYQDAPLSAADEAAWDVGGFGTLSRISADTLFELSTGAAPTTITLDLYTVCAPGNSYDISFNAVAFTGSSVQVFCGLYDAPASSDNTNGMTTSFAASPLGPADTGVHTLSGVTVDAANRYLKLQVSTGDTIEFVDVFVKDS